jgi:single-strand DNA-binding protein
MVPNHGMGRAGNDLCAELRKGSAVYVAGRLKPRQWQDKSGEKRFSLDVKATDVRFFGLPDSRSVRIM